MKLLERHFNTMVKDVLPSEELKALINEFMIEAGINMGNEFSENSLERTIEIIQTNFKYLPMHYVASAFKKGSLGHYGAGRLVPRVIYGWLNEISLECSRDQAHQEHIKEQSGVQFKNFDKYPLGQAIMKKIDWYKSGAIEISKNGTPDDWDKIDMKTLAEMLGKGKIVTPQDFGIEPKE